MLTILLALTLGCAAEEAEESGHECECTECEEAMTVCEESEETQSEEEHHACEEAAQAVCE